MKKFISMLLIAATLCTALAACGEDPDVYVPHGGAMLAEGEEPEDLSMLERASYARDTVKPMMESLRAAVDEAETLVSKGNWPVPSYTDLLHRV